MKNRVALPRGALAPGLALIFDMDGVIVDSNPMHRQAWAAFNRRFGLETTPEMHERMYGRRNDQIVRDFFGEDLPAEEVSARGTAKEVLYRDMVNDRLQQMLVPGVRAFLERYRAAPMALATNAEPENAALILDGGGLRPYFKAVVTGDQVKNPKPDPEIYLRAADLLETAPANCIVFEDSHSGVKAARAAAMKVIGVSTTFDYLPGVDLTIDNFENRDLTEWLAAQRRL